MKARLSCAGRRSCGRIHTPMRIRSTRRSHPTTCRISCMWTDRMYQSTRQMRWPFRCMISSRRRSGLIFLIPPSSRIPMTGRSMWWGRPRALWRCTTTRICWMKPVSACLRAGRTHGPGPNIMTRRKNWQKTVWWERTSSWIRGKAFPMYWSSSGSPTERILSTRTEARRRGIWTALRA